MRTRTMLLSFMLVVTSSVYADEPAKPDFTQLHRLSVALKSFTFPEKASKRITIWRQGSPTHGSFCVTCDDDEIDLSHALNCFEDRCEVMDLANIAVITDAGRRVKFIDFKADRDDAAPQPKLKRGHVVIFMVPRNAK